MVAGVRQELWRASVGHGDLVLLTPRNEPRHLLALLGVMAAGAVAVPVNPDSTEDELRGLLSQLGAHGQPRALGTDPRLAAVLRHALDDVSGDVLRWNLGELPCQPGTIEELADEDDDDLGEEGLAALIQTSGTTGQSKLVMQTHRAHVMGGEGFPYWMGLGSDDCLMTSLPLFHTNALVYSTMGSLACGAGLALLTRFSASGFLEAARRHGATSFNAVGAMLEILMRQPARADDANTPLRKCYVAPSPSTERHLQIERRFGLQLVCGYGLSESVYGLVWPLDRKPFGTLGWPRQHPTLGKINEARVVDEAGAECGVGNSGELVLRNPTTTPGYYGQPEETAKILRNGWLYTGDLVRLNGDGSYTFVARKKEIIRRRGENLSPLEVEAQLREHPEVIECAVVGVPSELSDEEVKAYVQLAPGSEIGTGDLLCWVRQRLAEFKVPRYWHFVDGLPKTATGRVAKHRLPAAPPGGDIDVTRDEHTGRA